MTTAIFLILSTIIFNGGVLIMPKRVNKLEMLSVSVFVLLLQISVDMIFDVKYGLYGYFNEGVDLLSFITFYCIYPATAIIILNYYPFQKSIFKKASYIIMVAVLCLVYEWLSLHTKYFYYNKWSLLYSAMCYPPLILLLAWYLQVVRNLSIQKREPF